jgi:hypothetical protein
MVTALDELSHVSDPSGPEQLSELGKFAITTVGDGRDQAGTLAGTTLRPLPVDGG